jgi:alpha-tubulin suppressor-like RCC1 family protein
MSSGASSGTTTPADTDWATAIAVGGNGACALSPTGRVRCWGDAALLGQADANASADRPVEVAGLADASAIAVGSTEMASFACALTTTAGEVWCWGDGGLGELGDGTTPSASPPVRVTGLSGVTAISAGASKACALLASGSVACWGVEVLAQGSEEVGVQTEPVPVDDLSAATAISVGDGIACAIVETDRPMCWGYGVNNGLGDGDPHDSRTPVAVTGLENVKLVSAGYESGCAIEGSGFAWCWGRGAAAATGEGPGTLRRAPGFGGDVAAISAGDNTRCAVTTQGMARCWGWAIYGLLGDGSDGSNTNTPVEVKQLPSVRDVAVSISKACALTTSGDVFCWGASPLGDGTRLSSDVAVRVAEE